ncbi:hypothetical protein GCM10020295_22440 [Streptomyces cinereospinus]
MVLESVAPRVFEMGKKKTSPHMTFVFPVKKEYGDLASGAIHVDGTGRIQTISAQQEPALAELLRIFEQETGVPCLLNTSFNVAEEPIVSSPEDALRCFLGTAMDHLVLEDFLVRKIER